MMFASPPPRDGTLLFVSEDSAWVAPASVEWSPAATERTTFSNLLAGLAQGQSQTQLPTTLSEVHADARFFEVPNATGGTTRMAVGGTLNADPCAPPNQCCTCAAEGEVVRCGSVLRRSGNYVACSEGSRQCSSGTWGACVGDSVATKKVDTSSVHTDALGTSTTCETTNPCDPYCHVFQDDANGLDAGAGLFTSDAGLTLYGTLPPALATCTGVFAIERERLSRVRGPGIT